MSKKNKEAIQREQQQAQIQIKASDDELKGKYSNISKVMHTREDFVIDFLNILSFEIRSPN